MPIQTQWFRDRIADKRMSQRALARAMGLDAAAVSLMLRGKREMKLTEAAEIARLLGVPAQEVIEHAGVRTSSHGKLISVSAILDEHQEVVSIPKSEAFDIPMPPGIEGECMAIQCRTAGTCMAHADGWIFFVRQPKGLSPDAVDRFSFVKVRGGLSTLAQVKRGYRPSRYSLHGPMSASDVELEWAEPVLLIIP
jgi:transcriptional regulator with XRE-family HTH domain